MTKSDQFRENAGNCALLAERAIDAPTFKRYRMEEARKALRNRFGPTARSLLLSTRCGFCWMRVRVRFEISPDASPRYLPSCHQASGR
jgi:hypothetical protein